MHPAMKRLVGLVLLCTPIAIHAWTPAARPGFKLDTLTYQEGSFHRTASWDGLGRLTDSSHWSVQSNGVANYLATWKYGYDHGGTRFSSRIHFDGTPPSWYSGTRTEDSGHVQLDHQGRDSCMDLYSRTDASYGTAGGYGTNVNTPCAIRWDEQGRVTYDGTLDRPTAWTYDDRGLVATDTTWYRGSPSVTRYGYDEQGRMTFRGDVDTIRYEYSAEGWRTFQLYFAGKKESWTTVEQHGDTAMIYCHGSSEGGVYWYLKDAWGDTLEEGRANIDSGFRITGIERDSLTRDSVGNVLQLRHFQGMPDALTQTASASYVWSAAPSLTRVQTRKAGGEGVVARIEWLDARGRPLCVWDDPASAFAPTRRSAGTEVMIERRLGSDGRVLSSRIVLAR